MTVLWKTVHDLLVKHPKKFDQNNKLIPNKMQDKRIHQFWEDQNTRQPCGEWPVALNNSKLSFLRVECAESDN